MLAIQAGGLRGRPIRRRWRTASRISVTPSVSLTARMAVDGTVCGLGGLFPVAAMTAAITTIRQASQPRRNASPFRVPFSALSIRMKAVSGNGSRVIPSPISSRSSTTPPPPRGQGGPASRVALCGYPPGCHGFDERLVVTLVLIGVSGGESGNSPVKDVRATEVGADGYPVSGAGVRPGERPAAERGVELQP